MREQGETVIKVAMTYGLYMGLALSVNSFVFYLTGKPFSPLTGYLSYAIIIGILSWSMRSLRESRSDEGLSYGSSLGFGSMIALFASFIVAFFTFVLYKIIDPGLMDKFLTFLEENMMRSGQSDDQMESMLNMYKKFLTPLTFSIGQILNLTFLGFFFSLILSIFYKKKPSNPFQEIE